MQVKSGIRGIFLPFISLRGFWCLCQHLCDEVPWGQQPNLLKKHFRRSSSHAFSIVLLKHKLTDEMMKTKTKLRSFKHMLRHKAICTFHASSVVHLLCLWLVWWVDWMHDWDLKFSDDVGVLQCKTVFYLCSDIAVEGCCLKDLNFPSCLENSNISWNYI